MARRRDALLTTREVELLYLLKQGYSREEVAGQLGISRSTLANHLRNIYTKLHVNREAEAIQAALQLGLLHTQDGWP